MDELMKTMRAPKPGAALLLMEEMGLTSYVFPELCSEVGEKERKGFTQLVIYCRQSRKNALQLCSGRWVRRQPPHVGENANIQSICHGCVSHH